MLFANAVGVLLAGWGVWWLLGVEQFLPALVLLGLVPVYARSWVRQPLPLVVFAALLVAGWWLVPLIRVERYTTFLRSYVLVLAQAVVVAGFAFSVRTEAAQQRAISGLRWFALSAAVACLVYATGLWQGQWRTPVGYLIGNTDSVFFADISVRTLGRTTGTLADEILFRLHGLSLRSTDLSLVTSLLLFFIAAYPFAGPYKHVKQAVTVVGLGVGLVFAQVRVAYLAVAGGVFLVAVWRAGGFAPTRRPLLVASISLTLGLGLLTVYITFDAIQRAFTSVFIEARSGSWYARRTIYTETFELLPQHPISGWGESVRIAGRPTTNAAGTHSDILQVLFQRGVVGLAFYTLLWGALWARWLATIRHSIPPASKQALVLMGIGLFTFQLQSVFSAWQWDHGTMLVIWTYWGILISSHTILTGGVDAPGG